MSNPSCIAGPRPYGPRSVAVPTSIAMPRRPDVDLFFVQRDRPRSMRSAPNTALASSVRPAPTRPAKPSISPERTSKEPIIQSVAAADPLGAQHRAADLYFVLG